MRTRPAASVLDHAERAVGGVHQPDPGRSSASSSSSRQLRKQFRAAASISPYAGLPGGNAAPGTGCADYRIERCDGAGGGKDLWHLIR